jgi:hypothetical protein
LITGNDEKVNFLNGNTLDNRLSNMLPLGGVEEKDRIMSKDEGDKQYEYFQMEYIDLPKNVYLLGKPVGTVFQRTGDLCYTCRVNSPNKLYEKIFPFDNDNMDEVLIKGEKWRLSTSYQLGLTKNLVKILDNDIIEIKIRDNYTTTTDFKFINLAQKYFMCLTRSKGQTEYYVGASVDNKLVRFHGLLTGYDFVDHIDRNPMNNCLSNLRKSSKKENNKNQSMSTLNTSGYVGVSISTDMARWNSGLRMDNKYYGSSYSISEYGHILARELAILNRVRLCLKYNSRNGLDSMKISWISCINVDKEDKLLIKKLIEDLEILTKDIMNNTIYKNKIKKIPESFWVKNENKIMLHYEYFLYKMKYYHDCKERLTNLKMLLNDDDVDDIIDEIPLVPVIDYSIRYDNFELREERYNKFVEQVKYLGGTCNSEVWNCHSDDTKMHIECARGHKFQLTQTDLNTKKWCEKCPPIRHKQPK